MENFTLIRSLGTITNSNKWTLEVNFGQWHDNAKKYDIRAWNVDHSKCSKGISLSEAEARQLLQILSLEFDEEVLF